MNFIIKILVSGLAVLIASYLLHGVTVDGMLSAVIVAAVLAVFNAILKPVLILLTLPVTILSLGLFLLVINAFLIIIASRLVPGFNVDGFWWALVFSPFLSVISSVLEGFAKRKESR